MSVLFFLPFVEPAIGLVLASVLLLVAARRHGRAPEFGRRRVLVVAAGLVVLSAALVLRVWGLGFWLPAPRWVWAALYRYELMTYLLPLAAGTVLVVAAGWPFRGRQAPGRATLERRGLLAAARPGWLAGIGVLVVAWAALAVAAGIASHPDENGDYTMYEVPVGAGFSGGTSIYGWYFSLPSAVGILVLLAAALAALVVDARASLRVDPALDASIRRHRAGDLVAATAGALLLHLGAVLTSLSGTASLTFMMTVDTGRISFVGPFAALGPALGVAGAVATTLGFALWWFVVLAALRRRRVPVAA